MSSFTSRQRAWIVGFVAVPIAAVTLAACAPQPTPAPAKAPSAKAAAQLGASSITNPVRNYWGTDGSGNVAGAVGDKIRVTTTAPPAITCNWTSLEIALEQCMLTYKAFGIDTTNTSAQARANAIAAVITPNQCLFSLDSFHSDRPGTPTLPSQYPGMSPLGENLHCFFNTGAPGQCPSGNLGAIHARDAWKFSTLGHKETMDAFPIVNGGAACIPEPAGSFSMTSPGGVYVAVTQFHF